MAVVRSSFTGCLYPWSRRFATADRATLSCGSSVRFPVERIAAVSGATARLACPRLPSVPGGAAV